MGDLRIAEALIRAAADAGVDIVKFQSWQADQLRTDFPDYDATFARHSVAELSDQDHFRLMDVCNEYGVEFLTTCFDINRIDFLAGLGMRTIKVASPDSVSMKLLDRLFDNFEHVIISTGMTTHEELIRLIEYVQKKNATILHCVSMYPAPLEHTNMARMLWIRDQGCRVGFSDHSMGIKAGMLAIALGAEILEKHITLNRFLPGKDQEMSSVPHEFRQLVDWAKSVEIMRGVTQPGLSEDEMKLRGIYIGKWGSNS